MRILIQGQWLTISSVRMYHVKALQKRQVLLADISNLGGSLDRFWVVGGAVAFASAAVLTRLWYSFLSKKTEPLLYDLSELEVEMHARSSYFNVDLIDFGNPTSPSTWWTQAPADESESPLVAFAPLPGEFIDVIAEGVGPVSVRWEDVSVVG